MVINDLCKNYGEFPWIDSAINGFLDDLTEHSRSKAPKRLYKKSLYDKIDWLVHQCEPAYTLEDIEDYFIDCQIP